jgi:hypothetical protein
MKVSMYPDWQLLTMKSGYFSFNWARPSRTPGIKKAAPFPDDLVVLFHGLPNQ